MAEPLVVSNVWKSFGPIAAVKDLSLAVPAGSVYGFLGPNGAGKSTTIRMILGLQQPCKGSISVFGQPVGRKHTAVLRRVGSMVETPSLYPHLTGRENLAVHCLLLGIPRSVIDAALESVDLRFAGNQVVRSYSSGMRQRLGLAQALLGNPDLLLLDEPTNALDPAGIQAVRTLIRDLPNRCGTTVLMSSHLLAEVEQVATHVAIIANGQLKFEGPATELRARHSGWLAIDVDLPHRADQLLRQAGLAFSIAGTRVRVVPSQTLGPVEINRLLVNGGVGVAQLLTEGPTLEQMFFALTDNDTVLPEAEAGLR